MLQPASRARRLRCGVHAAGLRWFVTVDDLDAKKHSVNDSRNTVFQRLRTALSAARVIADQGLDFVVAPIRAGDDTVLRRVEDRYAAAVYPFIDGTSYSYGDFRTTEHRDVVLGMVTQLHGVTDPAAIGAVTDDVRESWRNLQHFLDPAARWPQLT